MLHSSENIQINFNSVRVSEIIYLSKVCTYVALFETTENSQRDQKQLSFVFKMLDCG
jgi:hypothetical protein